jgi:AraC family transcriptional regulator
MRSEPQQGSVDPSREKGLDPCASFVAEARLPSDTHIQLFRLRKPAGVFRHVHMSDFTLSLLTRGVGSVGMDLGAGRFGARYRPGDFALISPGADAEITVDDTHDLLTFFFPGDAARSILVEAAGTGLADHGLMHAALNRDASIESLMGRVWTEAANGNPMGRLLAEDVSVAIMGRLARLAMSSNGVKGNKPEDAPPLHGPRLARVLSLIEDKLEADLSHAALGEAAGLSPWHFCRAFKAATGVAPHRFIVLRRLARAQWLIRTSRLTLAEVAIACGFSSHAHLTTVFRREVGTNPSHQRKEAKRR